MKEMTVQKMSVKKIFSRLRADLIKCIEYIKAWEPEMVQVYFGTKSRNEIKAKLDVICKPFSEYQMYEIEKVISELHSYFISKSKAEWEKKS